MFSILLIDDDEITTEVGKRMLEMLGYNVTPVLHSFKALEIFRKQPMAFDLVIIDYMMPRMKGNELAAEIRLLRPDIPLLLCTGHTNIPESTIREWGFEMQLIKPYNYREMGIVVHDIIRKNQKEQDNKPVPHPNISETCKS